MTLAEFVEARLGEREFVARANTSKINRRRGEWRFVVEPGRMEVRDDAGTLIVKHTWPNEGEHIALNDPAYVLADIAAKRELVKLHTCSHPELYVGAPRCDECRGEVPCDTILIVAESFASHPDYDPGWAP